MTQQENIDALINIWRTIIVGAHKSWVMFEHGTCVILVNPQDDLEIQAKEIMAKWGPLVPGTPLGDFSVSKLLDYPGWVVYYHHPDVISYVSPEELEDEDNSDPIQHDVVIGCLGRNKRIEDAKSLTIVHFEDKRASN